MSLSGVPIGTSTRPMLLILPTREKTFVPVLVFAPIPANHFPPRARVAGTFAQGATLFKCEGRFQRPCSTVWMYFALGSPAAPSREAMSAVDSPQTKAPAPLLILMSKTKPEPKRFFPRRRPL